MTLDDAAYSTDDALWKAATNRWTMDTTLMSRTLSGAVEFTGERHS